MADNSQHVRKSINFKAQPDDSDVAARDLAVDGSDADRLVYNDGTGAQRILLQDDRTDLEVVDAAIQVQVNTNTSNLSAHTGASTGVHGVTGAVVGTTDTQTLTNKTLTSPVLNTPTADTITGKSGGALTLTPASNQELTLTSNGTGKINADNLTFKTNTIASSSGAITINPFSGSNILLNGSGSGNIQFLRSGSTVATVDTAGITLASGKTLGAGTGTITPNTSGAITVPNATDTLVGKATTDVLTNKTIAAGSNTITGLAKGDVGLGNVDNTSDANKPVSTAQQSALDLKANLASPTLTGTPAAPTAVGGTNSTQIATTAFVTSAVSAVSGSSAATNFLSNSSFDYWQRGTSTTVANAATGYQADRWYVKNSLGTNGVITYAQVAGANTGSKYGASVKITTAPTAAQTNGCELYQTLENLHSLSLLGQVASFSAKIKALGNVTSVGLQFFYKTTEAKVDTSIGSEQSCTVNSAGFLTCALENVTLTEATITSAGVVGVRIRILGVSSGNLYALNNGFIVEQCMLNTGATAATYSRQYKNPKDEVADALRWYETGTCFQQQYTAGSSGLSYGSDKTYAAPKRSAATPSLALSTSSNLTGSVLTPSMISTTGFTVAVGAGSTGTSYFYQVTFITDASI